MKIVIFSVIMVFTMSILIGCAKNSKSAIEDISKISAKYISITPEEALEIMETEKEYVILDVRTDEEYVEQHIKDSVLIPDYEIKERAEEELPNKDNIILIYCRSGRRSKNAAKELISMGYTKVYDFGGINQWPYDTIKD